MKRLRRITECKGWTLDFKAVRKSGLWLQLLAHYNRMGRPAISSVRSALVLIKNLTHIRREARELITNAARRITFESESSSWVCSCICIWPKTWLHATWTERECWIHMRVVY